MNRRSQGLIVFVKSALIVGVTMGGLSVASQLEAKRAAPGASAPVRKPVDVRGNGKHEGQHDDRCDTDQDCRAASPPLTCQAAGDQKVCRLKPGTILPPT